MRFVALSLFHASVFLTCMCDWLVVVVQVLIFSQMTSILDILMDYCYLRGFQYSRLDGSMSYSDRDENVSFKQQAEEDGAELLYSLYIVKHSEQATVDAH